MVRGAAGRSASRITRVHGRPGQALRAEAEQAGEELVPYTFRHSYAKRSHAMAIPIANIAAAMGHTVAVHLQSYARFTLDATADLYEQAKG